MVSGNLLQECSVSTLQGHMTFEGAGGRESRAKEHVF